MQQIYNETLHVIVKNQGKMKKKYDARNKVKRSGIVAEAKVSLIFLGSLFEVRYLDRRKNSRQGDKLKPSYLPAGTYCVVESVDHEAKVAHLYHPEKRNVITRNLDDIVVVCDASTLVEIPRILDSVIFVLMQKLC